MNYPLIIEHIRATVPLLDGRVAGAADFARGIAGEAQMALPAAYVVPMDEDASPNDEENGLYQVVTTRFRVVVEFDNTTDRRGQAVTELYEPVRAALFAALLLWNPDPQRAPRGLAYSGAGLLDFDRARLFYQFEFALDLIITDGDGWQLASEPLQAIAANADPGAPWVPVRTTLPQE